jgi:hypothetical protein
LQIQECTKRSRSGPPKRTGEQSDAPAPLGPMIEVNLENGPMVCFPCKPTRRTTQQSSEVVMS